MDSLAQKNEVERDVTSKVIFSIWRVLQWPLTPTLSAKEFGYEWENVYHTHGWCTHYLQQTEGQTLATLSRYKKTSKFIAVLFKSITVRG